MAIYGYAQDEGLKRALHSFLSDAFNGAAHDIGGASAITLPKVDVLMELRPLNEAIARPRLIVIKTTARESRPYMRATGMMIRTKTEWRIALVVPKGMTAQIASKPYVGPALHDYISDRLRALLYVRRFELAAGDARVIWIGEARPIREVLDQLCVSERMIRIVCQTTLNYAAGS